MNLLYSNVYNYTIIATIISVLYIYTFLLAGVLTPYEGEVRLVGGAYASEGVVEINLHHSWARICSTDMELGLAGTICRQLGYTSAVR